MEIKTTKDGDLKIVLTKDELEYIDITVDQYRKNPSKCIKILNYIELYVLMNHFLDPGEMLSVWMQYQSDGNLHIYISTNSPPYSKRKPPIPKQSNKSLSYLFEFSNSNDLMDFAKMVYTKLSFSCKLYTKSGQFRLVIRTQKPISKSIKYFLNEYAQKLGDDPLETEKAVKAWTYYGNKNTLIKIGKAFQHFVQPARRFK